MSLGGHNPPSGIPTHRKATYVFTHTYVHTHIHTYIHTQTYRQVNKHMCVRMYIHAYVHIGGNLQRAAGKFLELT